MVPAVKLEVGCGDVKFFIALGKLNDVGIKLSFPVTGGSSVSG